jgi:hypothetical protein
LALIDRLRRDPSFAVAIATGGWEVTARYKLEYAGFGLSGIPLASSDDSNRRVGILKVAVQFAENYYTETSFDSVTYVGDGIWDAEAAHVLGFGFVGRGDPHSSPLVTENRTHRLAADFSDVDGFIHMVAG